MKDELISRQAVLDACDQSINLFEAADRINELPSVNPQPKTGKWTYTENGNKRCSECGAVLEKDDAFWHICFYCYHCGSYNGVEEGDWRNAPYKEAEHEVKICETCAHYGEDLHGANCRFCSSQKLWKPKVVSEDEQRGG